MKPADTREALDWIGSVADRLRAAGSWRIGPYWRMRSALLAAVGLEEKADSR